MEKQGSFNNSLFNQFLEVQIQKIKVDQKIKSNFSNELLENWINSSASIFRNDWDNSQCKNCKNWKICGWKVLNECEEFK